jgi:hypothetical protein
MRGETFGRFALAGFRTLRRVRSQMSPSAGGLNRMDHNEPMNLELAILSAVQALPLAGQQLILQHAILLRDRFFQPEGAAASGTGSMSPGEVHCVNCGASVYVGPSVDEYGGDHTGEFPFQPICATCARPVLSSHTLLAAAGVLAETVGLCPRCLTPHTTTGERYCVVCGTKVR